MLTKEEFTRCFYGNYIADCAVRDKNTFTFSARNEEESEENDLTGEWNERILLKNFSIVSGSSASGLFFSDIMRLNSNHL